MDLFILIVIFIVIVSILIAIAWKVGEFAMRSPIHLIAVLLGISLFSGDDEC